MLKIHCNYKKITIRNKADKSWKKKPGTKYCLVCKDFTHNFRSEEAKMTNKVLRGKSNCVVCQSNKMKTYCVKCRKNTENLDSKIFKTKNNKLIMQSKCSMCGTKKSRLVKEQEAKKFIE